VNYQFDVAPVIAGLPDLLRGCAGTFFLAISGMALATAIGIGGVAPATRDLPCPLGRQGVR